MNGREVDIWGEITKSETNRAESLRTGPHGDEEERRGMRMKDPD